MATTKPDLKELEQGYRFGWHDEENYAFKPKKGLSAENIFYYIRPLEKQAKSWEELPEEMRATWDKLGIPEAEKKFLGGVTSQYESEVVYHKVKEELENQGVIFLDMDSGLRE